MAIIGAADAVLVHLRKDPLFSITIPSKTQAYLYAGRPILMGVEGDAAALVKEAGAGYSFEPGNAPDLAQAILKLARMSLTEREQLGVNGRHFYQEHLCFECGVRRFEAVFYEAIRDAEM